MCHAVPDKHNECSAKVDGNDSLPARLLPHTSEHHHRLRSLP